MTKKLFFLKVKKSGGSKETDELKRKLESKSLLELLGMMDDVGKQRAADALKSVDPQQSLGISHLGLDGYLRKAFELLERGFPHMEGSGITYTERLRLKELRDKQATRDGLTTKETSEMEDLVEKEEEEELDITSKYYGILSDKIKAEMAASAAIGKLDIIKRNFSVETPIAAAVEQLGTMADLKHILNYRRADTYATKRSDIHKIPYASTPFASQISTVPSDYDQYVENEAITPLSNLLREQFGENITPEQIEKSPNILRYLGANVERGGEPHTTDPIDIVVIPSSDSKKIYAVEVKGRNRGEDYKKKPPTVGMNKFYYFNELRKKYPRKEVVPIVMWPNVPNTLVTGKYYTHIPSYSYVVDPEVAPDPSGTNYFTYTYDPETNKTIKKYVDKPDGTVESRQKKEIFKEYPKKTLSKVKNPRHTATKVAKSVVEQHKESAAALERARVPVSRLPSRRTASVVPTTRAASENVIVESPVPAADSREPVRIDSNDKKFEIYNEYYKSKEKVPGSKVRNNIVTNFSSWVYSKKEGPSVQMWLTEHGYVLPPKPVEKKKVKKEDDSKVLEEASRLVELQKVGIEKARADVDALYVGQLLKAAKPDYVLTLYNLWPERGVKKAKAKDIAGFIKKFRETGRWPEWGFSNFIQRLK
jgi:hypothetical protein